MSTNNANKDNNTIINNRAADMLHGNKRAVLRWGQKELFVLAVLRLLLLRTVNKKWRAEMNLSTDVSLAVCNRQNKPGESA